MVRWGAPENSMTLAAEVAALLALVALLLLKMADCIVFDFSDALVVTTNLFLEYHARHIQ